MTLTAIIMSASHNILFVIFLVPLYHGEQYKRNNQVKAMRLEEKYITAGAELDKAQPIKAGVEL